MTRGFGGSLCRVLGRILLTCVVKTLTRVIKHPKTWFSPDSSASEIMGMSLSESKAVRGNELYIEPVMGEQNGVREDRP